jgi:hypothetical protein
MSKVFVKIESIIPETRKTIDQKIKILLDIQSLGFVYSYMVEPEGENTISRVYIIDSKDAPAAMKLLESEYICLSASYATNKKEKK